SVRAGRGVPPHRGLGAPMFFTVVVVQYTPQCLRQGLLGSIRLLAQGPASAGELALDLIRCVHKKGMGMTARNKDGAKKTGRYREIRDQGIKRRVYFPS